MQQYYSNQLTLYDAGNATAFLLNHGKVIIETNSDV